MGILLYSWRTEKRGKPCDRRIVRLDLTLPYYKDTPTPLGELFLDTSISLNIFDELCLPEQLSRLGHVGLSATMSVPEAPVNEHRHTALRENQLRRAWHCAQVRPKPVAQSMQSTSHKKLRPRILATNPAHHFTAFEGSQDVSHLSVFIAAKSIRTIPLGQDCSHHGWQRP